MSESLYITLVPSVGGSPPLQASASTTVLVNLLDLNDNDPTFLNLPFVAEVPEGLSIGTSFFRVKLRLEFTCKEILQNLKDEMVCTDICVYI